MACSHTSSNLKLFQNQEHEDIKTTKEMVRVSLQRVFMHFFYCIILVFQLYNKSCQNNSRKHVKKTHNVQIFWLISKMCMFWYLTSHSLVMFCATCLLESLEDFDTEISNGGLTLGPFFLEENRLRWYVRTICPTMRTFDC